MGVRPPNEIHRVGLFSILDIHVYKLKFVWSAFRKLKEKRKAEQNERVRLKKKQADDRKKGGAKTGKESTDDECELCYHDNI